MNLLTNENFLLYASQNYDNPSCRNTDEFYEDLRRIKYVKKLITRFVENGDLKERLILNHLIILNNVFNPIPLCRILFLKMEEYLPYIKPFLIQLSLWQDTIYDVKKEGKLDLTLIPMDQTIVKRLREL